MSEELRKRIFTALIGGTVLISLIAFGDQLGTVLATAVISLLMLHEFNEITLALEDKREKRFMITGFALQLIFINAIMPAYRFELVLGAFFFMFTYFLFSAERHKDAALGMHFRELMFGIFGIVYLVFVPMYLPAIRALPQGLLWTFLFIGIIWVVDIGAYFVGKKYGRTQLYPSISPKKTYEGALGGIFSAVIFAVSFQSFFFQEARMGGVILMAVLVGVVSQVGDLCESFFKRSFDKKDSGSILPGHGGFLDRFDGLVLSLPVMYGCVKLFGGTSP